MREDVKEAAQRDQTVRSTARELAKDCIVTDALARFIEQVLVEVHQTQVAPLKAEIAALKRSASLTAIYAEASTSKETPDVA